MRRKTGLIGLVVLGIAVSVALDAQAAEKKTLEGVWEVKVAAGGRGALAHPEHCDLRRGRQFYDEREHQNIARVPTSRSNG